MAMVDVGNAGRVSGRLAEAWAGKVSVRTSTLLCRNSGSSEVAASGRKQKHNPNIMKPPTS
eukprot:4330634-Amphidinium_carterae.1